MAINLVDYIFDGQEHRIPVAIAGDADANFPPTLLIPGWGTRGGRTVQDIADIFGKTRGFGIVHVAEMPHQLARSSPTKLLDIYPEVAAAVQYGLIKDAKFNLAVHSMGTMALTAVSRRLMDTPSTTTVISGLFPQESDKIGPKASNQKMRKLAWRFGVVDMADEGGRMRSAGDSYGSIAKSGVNSVRDGANFVRHPILLLRTLADLAKTAYSLARINSMVPDSVGFVHGDNDPVFPIDMIQRQLANEHGSLTMNPNNTNVLSAPYNGHNVLLGHIGAHVAEQAADIQARLINAQQAA